MAQFLISAAHKSSGKTVISAGICAALHDRGAVVQPFKKGPDYIDPIWLSRAARRSCYNLDFYTMSREHLQATFAVHAGGSDIALIEGNKGLYDGLDLDGSNSNAALAVALPAPVVLVLDVRGMTRGIAPLLLGYQAFEPGLDIAGVIFNKVGGPRHEQKLRAIVEHYTDLPVIGAVPRDPRLDIGERHLGLVPANETSDADKKIAQIAGVIADTVDLATLRAIAERAEVPAVPPLPQPRKIDPDVVIGVARDAAFGFYYPDDLEALESAGAELRFFDTIHDAGIPKADGLFLGGGFPETHMDALAGNVSMRESIRGFVENGGPVYAECGGLMFLARSIRWREKRADMVGVLPFEIEMTERPVGRGYVQLQETGALPWGSLLEKGATRIAAHEFHYSRVRNITAQLDFAFRVKRGFGFDGSNDGVIYRNVLASYTHLRSIPPLNWARRFVEHVRREADRH